MGPAPSFGPPGGMRAGAAPPAFGQPLGGGSMLPAGGGYGAPSAAMQSLLEGLGELTITPSTPGQPPEAALDIGTFPRPAGPQLAQAMAAPPPAHEFNCRPEFLRMTVNAVGFRG